MLKKFKALSPGYVTFFLMLGIGCVPIYALLVWDFLYDRSVAYAVSVTSMYLIQMTITFCVFKRRRDFEKDVRYTTYEGSSVLSLRAMLGEQMYDVEPVFLKKMTHYAHDVCVKYSTEHPNKAKRIEQAFQDIVLVFDPNLYKKYATGLLNSVAGLGDNLFLLYKTDKDLAKKFHYTALYAAGINPDDWFKNTLKARELL